eukprot:TRINITY_DN4942_c0_g1_i8.p1 TRINITY_DN4942_c0_g1~~TRINITY_DN4942_c0_g1_i8.p1  ORF type:complete len:255 (+),score=24.80 TRINITY_DN4942_c0_g1_i8:486-1250(+)
MESFTVEISINGLISLANTSLLRTYAELDERCWTLGMLIKLWAKKKSISSGKHLFLSSYAYTLMVIAYLQHITPKVLPSLQKISAEKEQSCNVWVYYDSRFFKTDLAFETNPSEAKKYLEVVNEGLRNEQNIIDLLMGFFVLYSDKQFLRNNRISISHGDGFVPSPGREDGSRFSFVDPFNQVHDPGASCLKHDVIIEEMRETLKRLYEGCIDDFNPSAPTHQTSELKQVLQDIKRKLEDQRSKDQLYQQMNQN